MAVRIVDVEDEATFGLIPPCADPSFDHRSCDYWEDADRGSKAARPGWLESSRQSDGSTSPRPRAANPFLADLEAKASAAPNPFAQPRTGNPFLTPGDDDVG